MSISDERLRWLSGPDYIRSEAGAIAAELLAARKDLADAKLEGSRHANRVLKAQVAERDGRAKALEADRDQISLTLAVAKADRDKWFNKARDLEAALRGLYDGTAEYVYLNHLGDPHNTTPMRNAAKALGEPEIFNYDRLRALTAKETACNHEWQEVDVYPFKGWKCAKCGTTKT